MYDNSALHRRYYRLTENHDERELADVLSLDGKVSDQSICSELSQHVFSYGSIRLRNRYDNSDNEPPDRYKNGKLRA